MGMVSLSLPTIPVEGEQFVNEKDPLPYVRWHERVYGKDDQDNDRWWHELPELKVLGQDTKDSLSSSTGYHFFSKTDSSLRSRKSQSNQTQNQMG